MKRNDIYSVKVKNLGRWCHVFMTYNRRLAVERLKLELAYPIVAECAKIVCPPDWVVQAYVALNGELT